MNRWERVLDGEGQLALIVGEPGIGKSRLVQRFHEEIAKPPQIWVEVAASPFFQNTPFYQVAEMVREAVARYDISSNERHDDSSSNEMIDGLARSLSFVGLNPADAIPLVAPLLNLPLPPKYLPSALSPEQQRRRLLATLIECVLGATRLQPLVIVFEDLHWADPSTLELLQLLVEQGADGAPATPLYQRTRIHAFHGRRGHIIRKSHSTG